LAEYRADASECHEQDREQDQVLDNHRSGRWNPDVWRAQALDCS